MKISKKTVYKNEWFQIIDNHYIKSKKNYFTINMPDSSVILPITVDNEFIIIKQYRESLDNFSIELPAGFIEQNEKPIDAAKRELFEETGYTSKNFQYLGIGRLMINRTNSIQHLFVAKEATKKSPPTEKNTKVIKLTQDKLFDLIMKDEFVQLSGQGLILKYLIYNKNI
tara:strand:- start:492 stop:1001 length:510 start_codon:yes stop_codon:yes gene_type:complete